MRSKWRRSTEFCPSASRWCSCKWEELRPEVQNAMRQVHTDIGELLHPEQRGRFHEWLIRRREQHLQHQMIPSER